jgi:hypothetical protein
MENKEKQTLMQHIDEEFKGLKTSIRPFTYLLYTAAGIRPVYRTLLLETAQ